MMIIEDLEYIYHKRWGIETNYNTLKNRFCIENPKLIYENYFKNYDKLNDVFSDKPLLEILSIFAFFEVIDKDNQIVINLINELFHYRLTDEDNISNK